ncbi:uncharacterized protein V6R79_017075 [Siganus canaliculatus]
MKAHWWSCFLGFLCVHANFLLSTALQDPESISFVKVNSSIDIPCSTNLSDPKGLYLRRGFHGKENVVVFLNIERGIVTNKSVTNEFKGRILIAPDKSFTKEHRFTMKLSLLRMEDTDWYYCSWLSFEEKRRVEEIPSSKSIIIIVREKGPQENCKSHIWDMIFVVLSVTAFSIVVFLCIAALIISCKRFKKRFIPARADKRCRPARVNRAHHHVCHHHTVEHYPYLATSDTSEFRFMQG